MYGSQRSNLDGNQHGSSEHVVGRGCGGDATPIPIGSGCSRFLVTTAGGAGLGIIDITDLSHPRFITAFPTLDMGTDVAVVSHTAAPPNDETGVFAVVGTMAYVSAPNRGYGGGFRLLDVSDPAAIREMGQYAVTGRLVDLAAAGTWVHAGEDMAASAGLHVVDVSNPSQPQTVGSYAVQNTPQAVAVRSNYAFLAGSDGLYVLDVSDSTNPTRVLHQPSQRQTKGLTIAGSYLFSASFLEGISIEAILPPLTPTLYLPLVELGVSHGP